MVVANINLSKNKSNSQQSVKEDPNGASCSKYQSFKEQKQFIATKFRSSQKKSKPKNDRPFRNDKLSDLNRI